MDVLVFTIGIGLIVFSVFAFILGKLLTLQKHATEASHVSLMLAIAAFSNANAVKNAPVLRQVIERYVPIQKGEVTEEKVKEKQEDLAREFAKMYGFEEDVPRPRPTPKPEELV